MTKQLTARLIVINNGVDRRSVWGVAFRANPACGMCSVLPML